MLSGIYAECHKKPFKLSVIMLSVIMLCVVMLNVLVPFEIEIFYKLNLIKDVCTDNFK
jgi:hypothetical protein